MASQARVAVIVTFNSADVLEGCLIRSPRRPSTRPWWWSPTTPPRTKASRSPKRRPTSRCGSSSSAAMRGMPRPSTPASRRSTSRLDAVFVLNPDCCLRPDTLPSTRCDAAPAGPGYRGTAAGQPGRLAAAVSAPQPHRGPGASRSGHGWRPRRPDRYPRRTSREPARVRRSRPGGVGHRRGHAPVR